MLLTDTSLLLLRECELSYRRLGMLFRDELQIQPEPKDSAPGMFFVLTCTPAGKLGFVVAQSNGAIAAFFITAVFAVFFSIAAPQIRDAVTVRMALKLIPSAASRRMNFLILNEEGENGARQERNGDFYCHFE